MIWLIAVSIACFLVMLTISIILLYKRFQKSKEIMEEVTPLSDARAKALAALEEIQDRIKKATGKDDNLTTLQAEADKHREEADSLKIKLDPLLTQLDGLNRSMGRLARWTVANLKILLLLVLALSASAVRAENGAWWPLGIVVASFLLVLGGIATSLWAKRKQPYDEKTASPKEGWSWSWKPSKTVSKIIAFLTAIVALFAVMHWWPTAPRGAIVAALIGIYMLRWQWFRKTAVALIVLGALGIFLLGGWGGAKEKVGSMTTSSFQAPPADYERRHCDGDEPQDFSSDPARERIIIPLQADGCYHGPITLPTNWDTFEVFHSRNEGDWVSVWCNGHVAPKKVHPSYEDFSGDFRYCAGSSDFTTKFSAQGRGMITFRVLTYKR